jgi:FG-GAP-like repeat
MAWYSLNRACAAACVVLSLVAAAVAADGPQIRFKKTHLDRAFRSEGVAVGDYNHDGQRDIAAGSVYYAAPDWKMHSILPQPEEFEVKQYSHSFVNATADVNADGWDDLIVVDFPGTQTWWNENPGAAGGPWRRHVCAPMTTNESPTFDDLDGDGRRELILGFEPGKRIGFARPLADARAPWELVSVSAENAPGADRFSHGLGLGDVNGDGRKDVLVLEGWWEAPATETGQAWTFHKTPFGEPCAQMHVYDFDGDGDNDVLTSSAHRFGIWWHEQGPAGWRTHEIDKSFSQTHSLCLADINGDGLPDFVTGRRWYAHNGNDPGDGDAAVVFWYELRREGGRPVWTAHQADDDSGVGTQFTVEDVNGDGLLDIASSNKRGTHYLEQVRE